jgi:peptidyl-prolyl cis-trans isomerase A (cyclophilin A)
MKKIAFACSVILLLLACKEQKSTGNPQVVIETQFGDITLELYVDKAPKTATAFLNYVDSGWYERANFYRVLHNDNQPSNAPKSYLIQGGIWKSNNELAQRVKGIPHESTQQTGLKHDVGIVSMARAEPGTAGTEFFICLDREPGFDYGGENITDKQGFAAFAQVIKGMHIVRKIYEQRERNQYFEPPVMIFSIKRKK